MARLSKSQNLDLNTKLLELETILKILNEEDKGHKRLQMIVQEQSEIVCFIYCVFICCVLSPNSPNFQSGKVSLVSILLLRWDFKETSGNTSVSPKYFLLLPTPSASPTSSPPPSLPCPPFSKTLLFLFFHYIDSFSLKIEKSFEARFGSSSLYFRT